MMVNLNKKTGYVLHEEIIKEADIFCGGLNRTNDYLFYGFALGANKPKSVAFEVYKALKEKGFDFKRFQWDDNKGRHVFNGEVLRKAKGRYNNKNLDSVQIEDMYLEAFLFFLGKTIEDLERMALNYEIRDKIDHTGTTKPRTKTKPTDHGFIHFPFTNTVRERTFELIKKHLCDDFYLYSFNEKTGNIYKAIMKIRPEGNRIKVDLDNPTNYDYSGRLDYSMIDNNIVIVSLKTPVENKRLYMMLSVDLNNKYKTIIYQGQMFRFGKQSDSVSSDVFIERIEKKMVAPEIYEIGDQKPKHIRLFFEQAVYNKTEKIQFTDRETFTEWTSTKKVLQ